HRFGAGVERLDALVLHLDIELALHLPVLLPRLRRQVDHDLVDDRVLEVEKILGVEGEAYILDPLLNLVLRVRERSHLAVAIAARHRLEPALFERLERSTEPLAAIERPELPPQIHEAIGCGGAGKIDPPTNVR